MKNVYVLLLTEFLGAFADNAILFTVVAMVLQAGAAQAWYVPAVQSAFLFAFVVLAPWVGRLADGHSKPRVLVLGNLFKLAGAGLILAGLEPLYAYALVGMGAAVYGPCKYGILPELVGPERLVRVNGLIEGSTIAAIVLGTVVGARVADHSVQAALLLAVGLYAASTLAALWLPRLPARQPAQGSALPAFGRNIGRFFTTARARFSMLGAALFWAAGAVLRVLLVAWAPLVLGLTHSSDIAGLTLFLAIGIVAGAGLAPRLIALEGLRKARVAAYAMGFLVLALATVEQVWTARLLLLGAGLAGGLFVVPVNAALQHIGHRGIGGGNAVAIQNFFENLGMLAGVGLYTWSTALGGTPVPSMLVLGVAIVLATLVVSWRLPPDPDAQPAVAPAAVPAEGE
jgi:LPLT family lysophospholipid transporter-like MFS transporter